MSHNHKPNLMYDNPMYNEELKERFLSRYSDLTRRTYEGVFIKGYYIEDSLGKDIAEFNLEEIEQLLYHMNANTFRAIKSRISTILTYITWAIENGYRSNNINPLDAISSDWGKKFIDKTVMLYISKDELDDIVDVCKNKQDGVIFQLLFEGVDIRELCRLKEEDVDAKNCTLHLTQEDGSTRELKVSEKAVELALGAADETFYLIRNGEVNPSAPRDSMDLRESDYVIKIANTRKGQNHSGLDPLKVHMLYNRIRPFAELFDNPYLTSKNIYRSGLIYQGYLLWKRDGVLEKEQLIEICENNSMKKVKQGRYENYNIVPMKDYVNIENIKKLYDEKDETSLN